MTFIPPQSVIAEHNVVGCMLIDSQTIPHVVKVLGKTGEAFYKENNAILYEAMVEMWGEDKEVDFVTVGNHLGKKKLGKLGGVPYLNEVMDSVPFTENAADYAEIVKQKWRERKRVRVAFKTIELCTEAQAEGASINFLAETAQMMRDDLIIENPKARTVKQIMKDLYASWLERYKRGGLIGLSTDITLIDQLTGGYGKGLVYVIGGRPAMGKTSFALQICDDIVKQKRRVAFVTLEMSADELMSRVVFQRTGVDSNKIRVAPTSITRPEWDIIGEAMVEIRDSSWVVIDNPGANIDEICAEIEAKHLEEPLEMACIDYLQLIGGLSQDNLVQAITDATVKLKNLARKLEIPILIISQLNRGVDSRKNDHRPKMSDLRDSGGIEQNADVVMFCYRENYYAKELPEKTRWLAEVIVAKNRFGPLGVAYLRFLSQSTKFVQDLDLLYELGSDTARSGYPEALDADYLRLRSIEGKPTVSPYVVGAASVGDYSDDDRED